MPLTARTFSQRSRSQDELTEASRVSGPISLRVWQDLRREMEEFADKERRKLENVGETLL